MSTQLLAFNIEIPPAPTAPDWVQLIPAGRVQGRDGRWWLNDQPDAVVSAFLALQRDVPIDLEHSTELKAPQGDPAPAYGWVVELQVRDGEIWAHVQWTDDGQELVRSRKYRYLSPAFIYDETTRRVERLSSVGLTNKHNLMLPALNRQFENPHSHGDERMTLPESIRKALGLNAEAGEADALAAITQLNSEKTVALNAAQNPPLDRFVPRAEFETQKAVALNAQQELATLKTGLAETAITDAVDAAIEAKKVTPVNRDYYLACCREEGGLERFNDFVTKQPAQLADSTLDGKVPGPGKTALNAEQAAVASAFGNSAEDIAKYGQ